MENILIIGAGRSATSLISYLLQQAVELDWWITVADVDVNLAEEKIAAHPRGKALSFDIRNEEQRRAIISKQDIVISMLPAIMHGDVARDCVELGKHMATASYVSADMRQLEGEAIKKGVLLLNECGLDPGLDHASAMKVIDDIKAKGGVLRSFKSYCGGLVAPQSNDNPWGYKFSWNPRNVILAGQGTAQWLDKGTIHFIPYNRLFLQTDTIVTEKYGQFEAYANRDSISYIDVYGLNGIQTMLRGTLRQTGYCKAWQVFVALGLTDDTSRISQANKMTYTSLMRAFLPGYPADVRSGLKQLMGKEWTSEVEAMLEYLELFNDRPITITEGSPAQILQVLLEEKWLLRKGDRDLIVMQHQFEYQLPGSDGLNRIHSSLALEGKDEQQTAMAMTVGLPLAITVKNFLTGKFKLSGVQIPIRQEIYQPMLKELESHHIQFVEQTIVS